MATKTNKSKTKNSCTLTKHQLPAHISKQNSRRHIH